MISYAVKDDAFWVLPDNELSEYGSYVTEVVDGLRYVHPNIPRSCFSYIVLHDGTVHYQKYSPCDVCIAKAVCYLSNFKGKFKRRKAKVIKLPNEFDTYLFQSENRKVSYEELLEMSKKTTKS